MDKLRFMNNIYLSKLSHEDLFAQGKAWAKKFHPDLYRHMDAEPDYALAALSIERLSEKDPKRYNTYKDIADNILFFFDDQWATLQESKPVLPEFLTQEVLSAFIQTYEKELDLTLDVQTWFDQLKSIGKQFGFASNNQEFKEG